MSTKKKATVKDITLYRTGTNEILDRIRNGERTYIVQGNKGRRPIIAATKDEAKEKYLAIDSPLDEPEAEEVTEEAV